MSESLQGTPVTVKCRIGVDQIEDYASLHRFVDQVSSASPVRHFIIHARKCMLKGLNPHQNRTVPPLRYNFVYALKRDFSQLDFSINGGFQDPAEATEVLSHRGPAGEQVHGVMVGRAAFHMPWQTLARADTLVFGAERNAASCRRQVCACYICEAFCLSSAIGAWCMACSYAFDCRRKCAAHDVACHAGAARLLRVRRPHDWQVARERRRAQAPKRAWVGEAPAQSVPRRTGQQAMES